MHFLLFYGWHSMIHSTFFVEKKKKRNLYESVSSLLLFLWTTERVSCPLLSYHIVSSINIEKIPHIRRIYSIAIATMPVAEQPVEYPLLHFKTNKYSPLPDLGNIPFMLVPFGTIPLFNIVPSLIISYCTGYCLFFWLDTSHSK